MINTIKIKNDSMDLSQRIEYIGAMVIHLTTEAKNVQLSEDGKGVVVGKFFENYASTCTYYEDHFHILEYEVELGLVWTQPICKLTNNKIVKYSQLQGDGVEDTDTKLKNIYRDLFRLVEIDAERVYNDLLEVEKKRKIFNIAKNSIAYAVAKSSRYKSEVV